MDSSVHDNLAAPSPCQYTLKVLSNSLLGQYSNTNFAKPFLNRHVASRAVSIAYGISGCFQPGHAKVVLGPIPLGVNILVGTTEEKRVEDILYKRSVSALSAGAYTKTLLVMIDGSGRASPPLPGRAEFTIMMGFTPESGHCQSI
jgi:hypothetical protein